MCIQRQGTQEEVQFWEEAVGFELDVLHLRCLWRCPGKNWLYGGWTSRDRSGLET